MHGTTMMFLFAVPVMQGMQIYLTPLMVGTRKMAFPRLTAFSYWMYLAGGIAAVGRVRAQHRAGHRLVRLSAAVGPAIWRRQARRHLGADDHLHRGRGARRRGTLTATILKQRAPGMTLARMPLFVWSTLVTSLMVIFSMPSVALASGMLLSDRLVGTHFYNPAEHGDALLWQHLFWFFGHPEVYIIFLPGDRLRQRDRRDLLAPLGVRLSDRRAVAGRRPASSRSACGSTTCSRPVCRASATASSPPPAWPYHPDGTADILLDRDDLDGPAAAAGADALRRRFVITFVIGGLSGVMIAAVPLDLQLHDTYFIVAHFHYVLIGGARIPALGRDHLLVPEGHRPDDVGGARQGRLLDGLPRLPARLLPDAHAGLMGMPRRVYTYPAGMGLEIPNLLSSIGGVRRRARGAAVRHQPDHFAARAERRPSPIHGAPRPWNGRRPHRRPTYNFAHIPVGREPRPRCGMRPSDRPWCTASGWRSANCC